MRKNSLTAGESSSVLKHLQRHERSTGARTWTYHLTRESASHPESRNLVCVFVLREKRGRCAWEIRLSKRTKQSHPAAQHRRRGRRPSPAAANYAIPWRTVMQEAPDCIKPEKRLRMSQIDIPDVGRTPDGAAATIFR